MTMRTALRGRLPVASIVALAVVGGVTVLVAQRGGAVAVSETYPVPSTGAFTVTGHGNGHGHGLSQYGAKGRADAGQTYDQILNFYYPGTTRSTIPATAPIRIRLTPASGETALTVAATSGLAVRDESASAIVPLAATGQYRIRNVATGEVSVEHSTGGGVWTAVPLAGDATTSPGPLVFTGPALIRWVHPNGTANEYAGELSGAPGDGGAGLRFVNLVGLDEYVAGVVPAEVFSSWPVETLKAQAVAARTFAAFERASRPDNWFHTCDTPACQAYHGRASVAADGTRTDLEPSNVRAAVAAVAGQTLFFNGSPAFAQFSASNGGWTVADGTHPYLVSAADPFDPKAAGNPYVTWAATIPASTIAGCFLPAGSTVSRVVITARDGNGDWHGRITAVRVEGKQGSTAVSGTGDGDKLRSCAGLKSVYFTITSTIQLTTEPAAVTDTRGNADMFAAGPSGDVLHRRFVAGAGWQPWSSLGGGLTGSPGALRLPDNSSRVYIRGGGDTLYEGRVNSLGAFLGWTRRLTAGVTSRPYPVRLPDGTVQVFYLSGTALHYTSFSASDALGSTVNLGGSLAPTIAPAAAVTGSGAVTVVAAASGTNAVASRSLAGGHWSGWSNLGGGTLSDLGATSPSAGVVDIYLRGTGAGPLFTRRATSGRWGAWVNAGGGLSSGIFAATQGATGTIWAIGTSGLTYSRTRTTAGLGGWTALP